MGKRKRQRNKKVNKVITQQSNEFSYGSTSTHNRRGITVYSTSQLQQMTGRDKDGRLVSWGMEQPYFYLTIEQRIEMFRLSSPVFGVITSRMNRLAGMEFNIVPEKKEEDRLVMQMKDSKAIYNEYDSPDMASLTLRASIYKNLISYLPTLKPDLSNFDAALLRWKRNLKTTNLQTCDTIENWLMEPNQGVSWQDFVKKWVEDYYVHGSVAIYKQEVSGRIENFDILPGGTVYRLKSDYFSGLAGYMQVLPGYIGQSSGMPVYFSDEIIYNEYIPSSSRAAGMVPLEALINKIAEGLLFDKSMADQADGTKFPEKMIIVTDNNPFGSLDGGNMDLPLDTDEQKRIEEKVNTPVKGSVMTFSGNKAEVMDLSKENTMGIQMQRQKDIREETAVVFNMSNMEVNLSGSDGTSGRNTSESQSDIEQGKGIGPASQALKFAIQRGLIPFRFGTGFVFEFEKAKSEKEEKELDILSLQSGENTKNDIREKYNKEGYGEEYDKPDGAAMGQAGESELNPMFTRNL